MTQSKLFSNSIKIRDLVTGDILHGRINFIGQSKWERSYSIKLDVGGVIRITKGTLLPGFRFVWTPKLIAQFKLHTFEDLDKDVNYKKSLARPKVQPILGATGKQCNFRGAGYCECGDC